MRKINFYGQPSFDRGVRVDAASFAQEIRKARTPHERIAWFGALLAREAGRSVEVVGGSAVEIYLGSDSYVSQDVDLVGDRLAIETALRTWGFREVMGRSKRRYWTDGFLGLVDLVGRSDRSGLPPRRLETPYGRVLLSAPEPLIIRRLFRSKREGSEDLFRQAVALGRLGALDWEYLESEARFESVTPELNRFRKSVQQRRTSR